MQIHDNSELKNTLRHIDALLILTRGGLAVGAFLAYQLGIKRIEVLNLDSYAGTQKGDVVIKPKSLHDLDGTKLLIVDDICDTGDSLIKAIEYTKTNCCPESIETFAALYRTDSKYTPNYFMKLIEDKDWINFVWDNENQDLIKWIVA